MHFSPSLALQQSDIHQRERFYACFINKISLERRKKCVYLSTQSALNSFRHVTQRTHTYAARSIWQCFLLCKIKNFRGTSAYIISRRRVENRREEACARGMFASSLSILIRLRNDNQIKLINRQLRFCGSFFLCLQFASFSLSLNLKNSTHSIVFI